MLNVLFVCIGNSCRSQMAEGFARTYGSDVLVVSSAGLAPAPIVQPQTIETMAGKNIDIRSQFPKSIYELELNTYDVIVNISGQALPVGMRAEILTWDIADPMLQSAEVYVAVREKIEAMVMQFILEVRRTLRSLPAGDSAAVKPAAVKPSAGKPAAGKQTPVKPVAKTGPAEKVSPTTQRFGFGRVRRARD